MRVTCVGEAGAEAAVHPCAVKQAAYMTQQDRLYMKTAGRRVKMA